MVSILHSESAVHLSMERAVSDVSHSSLLLYCTIPEDLRIFILRYTNVLIIIIIIIIIIPVNHVIT